MIAIHFYHGDTEVTENHGVENNVITRLIVTPIIYLSDRKVSDSLIRCLQIFSISRTSGIPDI